MTDTSPNARLAHGSGLSLRPGSADSVSHRAVRLEFSASLPAEVIRLLESYTAVSVAAPLRVRVSDFVRFAVVSVAPLTAHTVAQTAAAVLSLTKWAHVDRGLPLAYGLILSEVVLEQWQKAALASKSLSPGTIRNYRGHLRRVASELGVTIDAEFEPLTRKVKIEPYTALELETHLLWTRTLGSDLSRTRGSALLALCVGAGLTTAELTRVRQRDVLTEGGMWVKVPGTNPRLTPVLAEWVTAVQRLIVDPGQDDPLFPVGQGSGSTVTAQGWLKTTPTRYRPSPQRLRATWVVSQLRDETNDPHLLTWSGIERGETLAGYLPFLGEVDPTRRRRLMALRSGVGIA